MIVINLAIAKLWSFLSNYFHVHINNYLLLSFVDSPPPASSVSIIYMNLCVNLLMRNMVNEMTKKSSDLLAWVTKTNNEIRCKRIIRD